MGLADLIELDIDTPTGLPNLAFYKVVLHLAQIFFAFITFCIVVPIISIQRSYNGASQAAPDYTLVVTLLSLFVAAPLAFFPWSRFKAHLTPIRNFFLRPRTTVIFTCFFTMAWFVAMISMTVDANDASNCTFDIKLQKSDPNYTGSWMKQCNSAKAAAAFSWLSFFVWFPTAICSIILLWHEKRLRHAETSAAAAATNSGNRTENRYDEDARTIVDMEYSEKDKQPVAHYDMLSSTSFSEYEQLDHSLENTPTTHPLPAPPSAPPMNSSGFTSPYAPSSVLNTGSPYGTPRTTPPAVTNLVSSYTPPSYLSNVSSVGSPYTVPASVVSSYPSSSSPYTTHSYQQHQPYNNIPTQQAYSPYNSPSPLTMEQPYSSSNNQGAYQPSPLAYTSPVVPRQQSFQQPMASYPQQPQHNN